MCVHSRPVAAAMAKKEKEDAGGMYSATDTSASESESEASFTGGKTGLAYVIKKLVTKEDPLMIHKVTGIFALFSFVYRYAYRWPTTGSLGFAGAPFDTFTMVMHMVLSASSIQFRVPSFRQPRRPTMIWNEYRLHAILFTARCCLVYILGRRAPDAGAVSRYAVTMSMHVIVDYVTKLYGSEGQTTIRGRNSENNQKPFITRMRRGYSLYQFIALASHLTPSPRGMDYGYNTIIAIQSSAFLMTLNRKGLASWQTHFKIYTACLVVSSAYIVSSIAADFGALFAAQFVGCTLLAFLCRTRLGMSKYVIWLGFALGIAAVRGGLAAVQPPALVAPFWS